MRTPRPQTWTAALLLVWTASAQAAGFLPGADKLPINVNKIEPNSADNKVINEYVGGVQPFQTDVFCPGTKIKVGSLSFDYAGWKGTRVDDPAEPAVPVGGAILRGGFLLGPNVDIMDGHGLRWLQTVIINTPTSAGFPQVDPSKNGKPPGPFYPIFPIRGVPVPFFDPPNTFLTDTASFLFETALVCVEIAKPTNIQYLGSFQWGYSLDGKTGTVTPDAPHDWMSTPTPAWFRGVQNDFPDLKLTQGCCLTVTPEPSSFVLLALGAVLGTSAMAQGRLSRTRRTAEF